ncbi:MAG TPA: hypothetical protein VNV87_12280 [Acidimicrobiales bacterium]|nr:hypothetical protein [Acidimicrobiales bacterium]
MKLPTNMALAAFVLAGIGLIGAIVLAAMSKTIPSNLWTVTLAALAGGAGISIPPTVAAADPTPVAPRAVVPAPVAPAPAPPAAA